MRVEELPSSKDVHDGIARRLRQHPEWAAQVAEFLANKSGQTCIHGFQRDEPEQFKLRVYAQLGTAMLAAETALKLPDKDRKAALQAAWETLKPQQKGRV
jgi:hypothetical protein